MGEKKSGVKKSGRVKRSRLGRGLSAMVDVPVVVEAGEDAKSDNPPTQKERSVSRGGENGGGNGGVVGNGEGIGSGGVDGGGGVDGADGGGGRGRGDGGGIGKGGVRVGSEGLGGSNGSGGSGKSGKSGLVESGGGGGIGVGAEKNAGGAAVARGGEGRGGAELDGGEKTPSVGGTRTPPPEARGRREDGVLDNDGVIRVAAEVVIDGGVVEIGVGLIGVNRDQPRRVFDEGALKELAGSILEHGLMQPVVVRRVGGEGGRGRNQEEGLGGRGGSLGALTPALSQREREEEKTRLGDDGQVVAPGGRVGDEEKTPSDLDDSATSPVRTGEEITGGTPVPRGENGEGGEEGVVYELVAGERRWRACMLAGLETIRAIVRDVDDETSAQLALIENVQREDLNVVELAEGYRVLSDRYSMTQERIAKVVGVSRSLVANTVRLLDLPVEVRDLIVSGKLSSGHGKVLLSLGVPSKQRKFAARCLKEGWNVRQLQRAVDESVDGGGESVAERGGEKRSPEEDRALSVLRDLEKRVGEELGTRVKIRTDKSRTRGRVVIDFFDLDQFDGLLGRLGVKIDG